MSRFPASLSDIEEASTCFAVSRYAAAIFHSVQVVEIGLIELGTFIRVADPKSGFSAVEKRLTAILATKHQDLTDFERDNFEFLEQTQGTVAALKNAWRNKISHAQGKLALLSKDFSSKSRRKFCLRHATRRLVEGLPAA